MRTQDRTFTARGMRGLWIATALLGASLALGGTIWAAEPKPPAKTLPDLLGKAPRPLPKNALHVQDIAGDVKGYTGELLVRGVVAGVASFDPTLVSLIDSREARTCVDLKCAKFYLPVKVTGPTPKEWEELDVKGTIVFGTFQTDPERPLLKAVSVKNLGSIR